MVVVAMTAVPAPQPDVEVAAADVVEEEFLAIVYADEELLRAEFDAIIATSWGQPGQPARPGRTPQPAPPEQPRRQAVDRGAGPAGPQHYPGGEGRSRQRAPPYPATAGPRRSGTGMEGGDALSASTTNSGDHARPGSHR
jgi:hypothetical protein